VHRLPRYRGSHGHVNIFEELPRNRAAQTMRRLDQIITRLPVVFPAQRIEKVDRFRELSGSNQKARVIRVPLRSHTCVTLGGGP